MVYHFKVHKESDGYWAECLDLKGCQTQGDSLEHLKRNAADALNLYLSEPEDSKVIFPLPEARVAKSGVHIIHVQVDPQVALAMKIRQARLKKKMTQREVADGMNLPNISAYQRLENPKTCNPEFKTLARLKKVLPELEIDDAIE